MNFLACDREQPFLMPPDPRDWLPEDHLAWFLLGSVEQMDLSAFFGSYRTDGWGRAAFEPSMMVSLLLYAYARGERSSRGIERKCVEDVAYRVIAAQQKPDHATIARFRARHEDALGELFSSVLGSMCKQAGLVKVGVIAIDGTKVHANASHHSNLDYEQLAKEILKEAGEIDAAEDELYGEARGDELPEHLRTREGRRAALAEAKQKLEAERAENDSAKSEAAAEPVAPAVEIELDSEVIVARTQGRDAMVAGGSSPARRAPPSTRQSRSPAHAPSGCSRPSDAFSKTSQSNGPRTRRMSTIASTGATNRAEGSATHRSHSSRPRYPPARSTRPILTRAT